MATIFKGSLQVAVVGVLPHIVGLCIGVARGAKGAMPPQMFGKHSHFVL